MGTPENGIHDGQSEQTVASTAPAADSAGMAILLFFLLGLGASLVVGWVIFPKLLYSQKQQPLPFNHKLHLSEVDNGCESCHFFREDGSFSGAPTIAQCVDCHEEPIGASEAEQRLVTDYIQKDREIPWLIYSRQPECAYFSHAPHVKIAHMACDTCHGAIGESTHLPTYEQNRLTGVSRDIWGRNIAGFKRHTSDRMKMDDCAECHYQQSGKKQACFVCHK
jgi:hypothetical protein